MIYFQKDEILREVSMGEVRIDSDSINATNAMAPVFEKDMDHN